jgi:hypothetical protein
MGKPRSTRFGFHHDRHEHDGRRIEIHEDQQFRWWWAFSDEGRVTVHGPYDTKRDAKRDANAREPHVRVATIPWKLP